ncbi:hypothetical protein HEP84_49235 [Streptomyces sp. RLB1-33]|nr:hypothetical protein [Streptomyces sp. RLB1-33]QIY75805.1 hypothetical protein HEP84_49235 [Streptomyces sp. RLB1-33]
MAVGPSPGTPIEPSRSAGGLTGGLCGPSSAVSIQPTPGSSSAVSTTYVRGR